MDPSMSSFVQRCDWSAGANNCLLSYFLRFFYLFSKVVMDPSMFSFVQSCDWSAQANTCLLFYPLAHAGLPVVHPVIFAYLVLSIL